MQITPNVSLRDHSTMRLGGRAAFLVQITSIDELVSALSWAMERKLPSIIIGGGSNIVWRDEGYPGLVIVNDIRRFELVRDGKDHLLTAGAGEPWDKVVERATAKGLTGIEALSLIPGTAGATPVQNVGAYGQEIAQTLVSVEAYDRQTGQLVHIPNKECEFGYRMSRFKARDRGRFCITAITLRLRQGNPKPPFYPALQAYLDQHKIKEYTPLAIRQAVIAIRSSKLPDPAKVANNGSFFANPIIDKKQFVLLQGKFPAIPHWPLKDGRVKLSAAWLLEQAGFKHLADEETGMSTWEMQPLVLVNNHAQSTKQLLVFKHKLVRSVQRKFNITLHQEPELLP